MFDTFKKASVESMGDEIFFLEQSLSKVPVARKVLQPYLVEMFCLDPTVHIETSLDQT